MASIISPGDRIELNRVLSEERRKILEKEGSIEVRTFVSQVYDIIEEDEELKIAMPIVEGRVIPLPLNARYDTCFYTNGGLYRARVVITERYKEGGLFILVIEISSELKKFQRRQYFRLECALDIQYRVLEDEDVEQIRNDPRVLEDYVEQGGLTEAIVLDISGGGVRFVSKEKLEPGRVLLINLGISTSNGQSVYGVMAKLLSSTRVINRESTYEQRVEYIELEGNTREAIIRFIFEQERRMRKM